MSQKVKRYPNCECVDCKKPLYRRPYRLRQGLEPRCRPCWRAWNRTRDLSHLRKPEVIEKRRQTIWANREKYWWKGGRYIEPGKGYVMVRCPLEYQAMARQNGYVLEHRLVMARHLSRLLEPGEVVHHLDGNLENNQIENLRLYSSHRKHYSENHAQEIAEENRRTGRTASYHLREK